MGSSSQAAPPFVRLAGHPLRWQLLAELAHSDLRVRELVALLDQPQNLLSYHLRLLRDGGLVTATRSSSDGRDSYYHLDLDSCAHALAGTGAALHPALGPDRSTAATVAQPGHPRRIVLFACTGNSVRSPIAEALLRRRAAGQVAVISAGSHPKARINPHAVRVLRDHFDVDIESQRPRHLDTLTGRRFDYVITLCDKVREVCTEFDDASRRLHWSVADPAAAGDQDNCAAFTRTAADIDTRVRHLLAVLATASSQGGPAMTAPDQYVSVRYLVDDVQAAVDFYTTHLGFQVNTSAAPAFADVVRGSLRLLLSGPASSGARATPDDATGPGRNRIHLIVDDLPAEIDRLGGAGLAFRSDLVSGPGGRQILIADPAGNLIELFQPARKAAATPQT